MTTRGQQIQQASNDLLETSRQIVLAEQSGQPLGELKKRRRMLEKQLRETSTALRESETPSDSETMTTPVVAEAATSEGVDPGADTEIDDDDLGDGSNR